MEKPSKGSIIYLANIRLPTEKAHGYQIMKTCEAFAAQGYTVELHVPKKKNKLTGDPFDYYRVPRTFSIRRAWSIDSISIVPGKLSYIFSQCAFAVGSFVQACLRDILSGSSVRANTTIYTRDEIVAAIYTLFGRRVLWEAHDGRWNMFVRIALARCTGIICITRGVAASYAGRGLDAARVHIAPDGVDMAEFGAARSIATRDARVRLGLPQGTKVVLYTGHLYGWKGVDTLARAAALLDNSYKVIFVGGTEHDIRSFKAKYAGDMRISIVGHKPRSDMPLYAAAADVLVLPNSSEQKVSALYTSPLKLFEYMASGKPIVASDLQSLREVIDEETAILVQPDDAEALAQGIRSACDNAVLSSVRAAKALKAVERYTWLERAKGIIGFIEYGMERSDAAVVPVRKKDTAFYDKESVQYSRKRYPELSTDYIHYFFKRRLSIVSDLVAQAHRRWYTDIANGQTEKPSLYEIGCADGVVLRHLYDKFGNVFERYRGNDISEGMVRAATGMNDGRDISYEVRSAASDEAPRRDIIVEVGVLNYSDFSHDMRVVAAALDARGLYICSVAGRGSIWARIRASRDGFNNFLTYEEYETKIRTHFDIIVSKPVGLYMPLVWRIPALARAINPIAERIFAALSPGFFHEKVYLLRKKSK